MKKLLIIFLILFATTVQAVTIIPEEPSFFTKIILTIKNCGFNLKCYFPTQKLGTSYTTIWATTTVASYPTIHNANFAALNAGKVEISTTTMYLVTSLLNLATVGTITTGTWNADAISVAKGGSGTTTPSKYQVILGNGSSGFTVASGTGTAGQFLTSNGTGANPTWQTSSVSQGANYTWTGGHIFNSASTTVQNLKADTSVTKQATSTQQEITGSLKWGAVAYAPPSSIPSSAVSSSSIFLVNPVGDVSIGIAVSMGATSTNPGNVNAMVISHGLGRIPNLIEITANSTVEKADSNDDVESQSVGMAISTKSADQQIIYSGGATIVYATGINSGVIVYLVNDNGTAKVSGIITGITATTFTLNLTTNTAGVHEVLTRNFLWKVQ